MIKKRTFNDDKNSNEYDSEFFQTNKDQNMSCNLNNFEFNSNMSYMDYSPIMEADAIYEEDGVNPYMNTKYIQIEKLRHTPGFNSPSSNRNNQGLNSPKSGSNMFGFSNEKHEYDTIKGWSKNSSQYTYGQGHPKEKVASKDSINMQSSHLSACSKESYPSHSHIKNSNFVNKELFVDILNLIQNGVLLFDSK